VASDGADLDFFGISVAVDGDSIVVGAPNADGGGAAYAFTRSGTTWIEQDKLTALDRMNLDLFGSSVALEGNVVLVGAERDDVDGQNNQGSAYVFTRSGNLWSEQQKLVALDGAADDWFGTSVAISGDTALIGSRNSDVSGQSNMGAVYVFTRTGNTWSQQQKLSPSDGYLDDRFGESVALSGDTALVGTAYSDVGGESNVGAAYVFTRDGTTWTQEQRILSEDGSKDDFFGVSVALFGDTAMVGATGKNAGLGSNQGQVYFFERQPTFDLYLPIVVKE
jgi:hypothetical protein